MPVPPVIQMYRYVMGSGGGVSNLLLGSEELGSTGVGRWNQDLMNAVNSDQVNNPEGTEQTADQLDFQASKSAKIRQDVTLVAGTEYTFSVWARAASGTQPFRLRYYDNVGGSGGASAFTASATWSPTTGRYSFTFTAANSGTFTMMIQNAADAVSRRIYFWGAMLNVGATAADYIKTTFIGPSSPATPLMEFGDNFAGVTAYYSLRRFTIGEDTNAIRVRRSSDDTEQDIGFDANGDLDTTALTTFVNASYTNYQSDFSSTGQDDLEETNGTGAIDQSVGGVDEAYLFTNTATGSCYPQVRNLLDVGQTTRIQLDYYIPSGQDCDMVILRGGSVEYTRGTTVGSWASIDITATVDRDDLFLFLGDGGSLSLGSTGNELYLKNIVITQTTADGAVTTFYDQTGNGNDATNATESEQPLIVDGGSVVTMGGASKAAIEGSTSSLALSTALTPTNFSIIHTSEGTGMVANINGYIRISNYYRYNIGGNDYISSDSNAAQQSIYVGNRNGTTLNLRRNGSEMASSPHTSVTTALNITTIFNRSSIYFVGKMSEIIIFESDQSSNLTGISSGMEGNINTYFDIV